jgi:chemotaxis response regulator CheB
MAAVAVALLGRDDGCRAQLRLALQELGAEIVHEGGLLGADCAAIASRQPSVVLVNLEPGVEDALDALDPLFEDPSINVVFNEAESTSQLSGWDLSRWARHLAAKVLGHGETVPPPPAGAEILPLTSMLPEPGAPLTPAQEVGDVAIDRFAEEAANSEYAVPSSLDLSHEPGGADATPAALEDFSLLEPQDALSAREAAVPALEDALPEEQDMALPAIVLERELHGGEVLPLDDAPLAVAVDRETHGGPSTVDFALDLGAIEHALAGVDAAGDLTVSEAAPPAADADGAGGMPAADLALPDDAFDSLLGLESLSLEIDADPAPAEAVSRLGSGDELGGLDLDFDLAPARPLVTATEPDVEFDHGLDDEVAALAAQFDARSRQAEAPQTEAFDGGLELAPVDAPEHAGPGIDSALSEPLAIEAPVEATALTPADARTSASGGAAASSFGELSLEAVDDAEGGAVEDVDAAVGAKPAAGGYDFSGLSLSLEPLDGETLDLPGGADAAEFDAGSAADGLSLLDHPDAAEAIDAGIALAGSGLALEGAGADEAVDAETGGLAIPRVIVLGASIGGPDALRTFLSSLPADFPALLLLCQHLDNGFFARLAQQLAKVSKLPVRVADDGAGPARPGEVLVVPSSHRFAIDAEGEISAIEHAEAPRYKPCIDDLMRDIAETFGRRATAIIFSGMAGDAIEGAVQITAHGGEVWAQAPDSCVVSSMVDGARARGVVEFVGSPRELAEQCIKRYGRRR